MGAVVVGIGSYRHSVVPDDVVPVLDLSQYGQVWLIDVAGREASPGNEESLCRGIGLPYPKPFSAVFLHTERIWLQVGPDRWDAEDIVRVLQTRETVRGASYELHMTDGSINVIEIRLPPSVAAFRLIDPTHDEIESWSEDIMKVLPYTAADGWTADPDENVASWVARVKSLWRTGISVPRRASDG